MKTIFIIAMMAIQACGAKDKGDVLENSPTPVDVPTSTASPTPKRTTAPALEPTPSALPNSQSAQIWIASNASRFITAYDLSGTRIGLIDLSGYASTGAVTSLTFLTRDILIATLDPGTASERIIRIDLNGENYTAINPGWFSDATNFNNILMYKILKLDDSRLIAVKSSAQIEKLGYNLSSNITTRIGAPWIATVGACTVTANQYVIPIEFSGTKKLLGMSSGANTRLNVYGGVTSVPTCDSSYNYTSSYPTAATYTPIGAAQLSDGKVYVRFRHATTPVIARYDYNGTSLSAGIAAFNDTGTLGADAVSREMVSLDGNSVLFANWVNDSIVKWDSKTGISDFLIHDGFSVDVNAIAIRPEK